MSWNSRAASLSRCLALLLTAALLLTTVIVAGPAEARKKTVHRGVHRGGPVYQPPQGAIVIDADTGSVLYQSNADARTYPASLTKMMTLYLLFGALDRGQVRLDQVLTVSRHAASMPATSIGLDPGDSLTVEQAIHAIIVQSANDAASTVAEALAGSEDTFADAMTRQALRLGMSSTIFRNASGLPDLEQKTTARDIATLARALVQSYPAYYHFFSEDSFSYAGRTYVGHNRLLKRYDGADGLKTGYIRASGFNLATSAVRNGHRVIGVVLGGRSAGARDAQMMDLLDRGFAALGPTPGNTPNLLIAKANPPPRPTAPIAAMAEPVPTAKLILPLQPAVDPEVALASNPIATGVASTKVVQPPPAPAATQQAVAALAVPDFTPVKPRSAQLARKAKPVQLVVLKQPAALLADALTDPTLPPAGPTKPQPDKVAVVKPVAVAALAEPEPPLAVVRPAAPKPGKPAASRKVTGIVLAAVDSEDGPPVSGPSKTKPAKPKPTLASKPRSSTTNSPQAGADRGDTVVVAGGRYAIQVGAYSKFAPAQQAAVKATRLVPTLLRGTHIAIDEKPGEDGPLYRARVVGLTQASADAACRQLKSRGSSCLVVSPGLAMAMSTSQ